MLSEEVSVLPLQHGIASLKVTDLVPHIINDTLHTLSLSNKVLNLAGILRLSSSDFLHLVKTRSLEIIQ